MAVLLLFIFNIRTLKEGGDMGEFVKADRREHVSGITWGYFVKLDRREQISGFLSEDTVHSKCQS